MLQSYQMILDQAFLRRIVLRFNRRIEPDLLFLNPRRRKKSNSLYFTGNNRDFLLLSSDATSADLGKNGPSSNNARSRELFVSPMEHCR
jgi:hypothetical protein